MIVYILAESVFMFVFLYSNNNTDTMQNNAV